MVKKRCSNNSKFAGDDQYICNEKTGRWIKIGGPTYKKLNSSNTNKKVSKYENDKNYVLNEKTGKWIKIGGPTYNKIHNKKVTKKVTNKVTKKVITKNTTKKRKSITPKKVNKEFTSKSKAKKTIFDSPRSIGKAKLFTTSYRELGLTKNNEDFDYPYSDEVLEAINNILLPKIKEENKGYEYINRGDILHIRDETYRNDGKFIYNGVEFIRLDDEVFDYGSIPSNFPVISMYPIRYWSDLISYGNFVYIDRSKLKFKLSDIKNKKVPKKILNNLFDPATVMDDLYVEFSYKNYKYHILFIDDRRDDTDINTEELLKDLQTKEVFEYDRNSDNVLISTIN